MPRNIVARAAAVASFLLAAAVAPASLAQERRTDETELAKQTQNPVANLISLPTQLNFNSGGDLDDGTLLNVNFQPVAPFSLTADWNVIARAIVPYLDVPTATGSETGLGDIQTQFFFTPRQPGALVWGVGPTFSFPTATNAFSRTGTWAAGAGAVVVKTTGPFVLGVLATQFWPAHDSGGSPRFDQLTLQPFVNYNFGKGWAISSAPLVTANWDADDSDERWTIPLGLGITRTTHFGKQPMSLGLHYYNNIERPTGAPASQLRFVISLLFPE